MRLIVGVGAVLLGACACGETVVPVDAGARSDAAGVRDAGGFPDGGGTCLLSLPADTLADERTSCTFTAGATAADTLGIDDALARRLPIDHIVVVMQENRSFDHYFATLDHDVDPLPSTYTNPDLGGVEVAPFHLPARCLEADPPHQWAAMHSAWNGGGMNGFVVTAATGGSDGRYAMGFYDASDLPFYHWAARTFAFSDAYFGDSLGGTWSNRAFLYTGSSHGVHSTGELTIPDAPTVFDALDDAGVTWATYSDGFPRQDLLEWTALHPGVYRFADFLEALTMGTLPAVSFVDPGPAEDEHPANDISPGEDWSRQIYEVAATSPLWPRIAVFLTYDESGGLFDHVAPPAACAPSPSLPEFDRLGIRVPVTLFSPWARAGHVSHEVHSHASILRFIELRFGLPAFSDRDANADAMLDLFDFCAPSFAEPPLSPAAGLPTCG